MQNRGDIIGSAVLILIGIGVVIGSIRLQGGDAPDAAARFFPLHRAVFC